MTPETTNSNKRENFKFPAQGLVRIQHILAYVPVSRATVYRLIEKGEFPKPSKIGASSVWRAEAVHEFMAEKGLALVPALAKLN